jgi:hypothetical protein
MSSFGTFVSGSEFVFHVKQNPAGRLVGWD